MTEQLERARVYDPDLIRSRIKHERTRRDMDVKQFAALCGLSYWSLYKKDGGKTDFQTADLIKIGAALDAPTLWPLVDWWLAEKIDREIFGKPKDQ